MIDFKSGLGIEIEKFWKYLVSICQETGIKSLYKIILEKDASLIEINPLIITKKNLYV